MKKRLIYLAAFVLAGIISVTALPVASASGSTDYIITNAYENVDWDTWNAYKAQLHCHTIASDGAVQLNDVVEISYNLGYDILAVTDHAIVHKGWNVVPQTVPIFRLVKYDRTQMSDVIPVTEERYQEILNGVGRGGRGMLDVEMGIELNGAVPSNSHVNGFFADYGQGLLGVDGDYETPVRENGEAGGITFLDHLGSYIEYRQDKEPLMEDSETHINKFAKIFLDYPSCVGMDISSGISNHPFSDTKLYDNILQRTIPNGVTPWGFSFSDAHTENQYDIAYTVHMMTELTNADLRRSMEEGTFFGISRYARHELGADFAGEGPNPIVTRIDVNEAENRITLECDYYDKVVWVANGVEIATGESIDLNEHEGEFTCYVRAYLTGPGGICYVQPFTILEKDSSYTPVYVPDEYDYADFLRDFTMFLDALIFKNSIVVDILKGLLLGL